MGLEKKRSEVKAPNEGVFQSTDGKAQNGFLPLYRHPGPGSSIPNMSRFMHGDPGGSFPLTKERAPGEPPNETKFKEGDPGITEQVGFVREPGSGAIPVNPFVAGAEGVAQAQPDVDWYRARGPK